MKRIIGAFVAFGMALVGAVGFASQASAADGDPTAPTCSAPHATVLSTDLDKNGWTNNAGVNGAYVPGGFKFTIPSAWDDQTISRTVNKPLSEAVADLAIAADNTDTVGLKFHTGAGIISFEYAPGYGYSLWSAIDDFPLVANAHPEWGIRIALVSDWVAQYPDLPVTSVDLLATSVEASTRTVSSVSFGCTDYFFSVAQPCTATGQWFTEDVAPLQQPGGLMFAGPQTDPVDYYHPTSGNLQGIVDSSMTITTAGGYHAALVWEIYRYGGTVGYATIVAEPYMNGWAPDQIGTFTVTQSTLVWTSKIPTGPGSQDHPISLAAMGALFPANALITEGIHLGSNSIEGQFTLVSGLSGCVAANFVQAATPTPTPSPTGGAAALAATGSNTSGLLGFSGALLLMGAAFLALRTLRHRASVR